MQHLPPTAGIGLKPEHYREVLDSDASDLWVEVHPENYMVGGGPRLAWLEAIRAKHPLSLHGVGASLGGGDGLDPDHLARLRILVDRFEPQSVSEHASWSAQGQTYFADLLPLPRTRAALDTLCANIDAMQNALRRTILIENPTIYIPLKSEMDEPDFLAEACARTGCGLVLDVNNVHISAFNAGFDARDYLSGVDPELVHEVHVAGFSPDPNLGDLLIDSHASPVDPAVWSLLSYALNRVGEVPVLLERDGKVPDFATLMAEREEATTAIAAARAASSRAA